jgi:hypothetical protein
VGDAEDFAQSLRSVFALLADVREYLTAGRKDTAEAAERLAVVMLGSTNPAAETAEAASADATRKVDEALRLIDRSADELAGYLADVLGPGAAAGALPAVGGSAKGRPVRDIDIGESLQGATRAEVADAARRAGWSHRGRSRDGNGDVWVHPVKKGEQVIINDGYPGGADPLHRGPYVKISRGGTKTRYPLSGA